MIPGNGRAWLAISMIDCPMVAILRALERSTTIRAYSGPLAALGTLRMISEANTMVSSPLESSLRMSANETESTGRPADLAARIMAYSSDALASKKSAGLTMAPMDSTSSGLCIRAPITPNSASGATSGRSVIIGPPTLSGPCPGGSETRCQQSNHGRCHRSNACWLGNQ
ncbi:hypothetical protein D3C76_1149740 [compost metagenome]